MNYTETLQYLYTRLPMFTRIGKAAYKANLDNTHDLMEALDHPENGFKSIHVAGTNGKGSTSHYIAAIMQAAGFKTGLYTSPHLKDFRERIRINGEMIPQQVVIDFVKQYQSLFEHIEPSFFEWTVALCFDYFAKERVDIAIIETGLGGRLDSTNVITPLVSVITNIGYDHMDLLGDTLEKIAVEKAGIIKREVPLVIGEAEGEVRSVFMQHASNMRAPVWFASKEFQLHDPIFSNGKLDAGVRQLNGGKYLGIIHSQLGGQYQLQNISTVLTAIQQLPDSLKPSWEYIQEGLAHVVDLTGLMGRWQMLSERPFTVADTGHNKDGIQWVLHQLSTISYKTLHVVWGMVSDKDISGILALLPKNDVIYYFCKADLPRALDAESLRLQAREYSLNGNAYTSVKAAYEAAQAAASDNDLIYIGGSTFVVAEVI